MTNEEIQALQALSNKATPGPWDTHTGNVIRAIKGDFAVPIFESRAPFEWHKNKRFTDAAMLRAYADEHNNAAFIAAAREAVPALCADLLAARAEVARLREALGPFAKEADDWEDKFPDTHLLQTCAGDGYAPVDSHFTIGDLRRARAELEGGK